MHINFDCSTASRSGRCCAVACCCPICCARRFGLTGTHVGCDTSQCGACVVHVDGVSVKSCTLLAVARRRRERHHDRGSRASGDGRCIRCSRPSIENHGLQCGFCTPGMIMSAVEFAKRNPEPDARGDVRHWLEGNICRCTGYQNIVASVIAGTAAMHATDREPDMTNARPASALALLPQGRSALPHRPRQLCRRHQAAEHGDGRVPALAACARRHQVDRHRRRRSRCRASSRCSPARI